MDNIVTLKNGKEVEVEFEIDKILIQAVEMGATDVHISTGTSPKARVHGTLEEMGGGILLTLDTEKLLMPLMDAKARKEFGAVGQYDLAHTIHNVARFRVNIFKQKGAMAGVFRILKSEVPDYTKLGLPNSLFALYRKRRGLILIVGTTGSGKSTTLASFLNIINKNSKKHIITLEDPIEYLHWHNLSVINQREIGTDCTSFAEGLRGALREDPDVILIGEMRDLETTDIALKSAETGHLVCSTLHTMGAPDTINRIIDMYPEAEQKQVKSMLSGVLEAVVSQQLLPKADGSGYVVAYELLYNNKEVKKLLADGDVAGINEYIKTQEARKDGMIPMDWTIFNLWAKGIVSRDTALDYAFDRKFLDGCIANELAKRKAKLQK